jgi:hypothetical protein
MMFSQPIKAMFSAVRLLFQRPRALLLMLAAYAGLLTAIYLFVSTREATIGQLILTMAVALIAPALFFVLQAASVSYTSGPLSKSLIRNCLRLIVVSVPVIAIMLLGVYGLGKVDSYVTLVTALRYLLIAVVAPLLAIQLWIVASGSGLRVLLSNVRRVAAKAFGPQSLFVYLCGFVIFAVVPYILLMRMIQTERAWLEFSLLILRLTVSALLILLGWVTTVGAISILNEDSWPQKGTEETK